ncbi:MAG TPA: exosortase K [Flavobacteriales bacterium]|nr:exosortase K [Flavobacteriales bacterium]
MPATATNRFPAFVLPASMLLAAFGLKWWYRSATTEELGFVLRPVVTLVGLISGESWTFNSEHGYFFPALNVLIDRSCSGVNFFVITAATFAFIVLKNTKGGCARPLLALFAAVAAYGLTLLANTGRILAMIHLDHLQLHPSPRAHEAIGAFFFLFALLLATLALDRFLSRHSTTLDAHTT